MIHFIWYGCPLPDWGKRNIESAREKTNQTVTVWTDKEKLFDMIESPKLIDIWNKSGECRCHKSDVARLAILKKLGGWYLDLDVWCMRELEPLEPEGWFGGTNHSAMFYGEPDWPHWELLISFMARHFDSSKRYSLWKALMQWLERNPDLHECHNEPDVNIEPNEDPDLFFPWFLNGAEQPDKTFVHPFRSWGTEDGSWTP